MKFFEKVTKFLVAVGTIATACATIYTEYNKQQSMTNESEKKIEESVKEVAKK